MFLRQFTELNFTFTIPKCLKYKIKVKDHNTQTQQHFCSILIHYTIMGYMFRLLFESSSGLHYIDPDIPTFTVLWDLQRLQNKMYIL